MIAKHYRSWSHVLSNLCMIKGKLIWFYYLVSFVLVFNQASEERRIASCSCMVPWERERGPKFWNILVCFGYSSRQKIEDMFRWRSWNLMLDMALLPSILYWCLGPIFSTLPYNVVLQTKRCNSQSIGQRWGHGGEGSNKRRKVQRKLIIHP